MKIFLKIIAFGIILVLFNSCAKPTVVNVVVPGDEKLNCQQLEKAIADAEKVRRDAEYAKGGTGGNTARMLLFWPAWAQTLHNADVAIMSAKNRTYHLINIMEKKKCEGTDIINARIIKKTISPSISDQLKELKEMYVSGDLTKEEFEKAKTKILN